MENMERICERKVDELGRIVLPSEVRSKLGWGTGDSVSLYYVDDDKLLLQLLERHPGQRCVFCGVTEAVKTFKEKDICGSCLDTIKKAD